MGIILQFRGEITRPRFVQVAAELKPGKILRNIYKNQSLDWGVRPQGLSLPMKAMTKKELIATTLIIVGLLGLWLINRERLSDYDNCYMEKYNDWSTDCVLTKGGE